MNMERAMARTPLRLATPARVALLKAGTSGMLVGPAGVLVVVVVALGTGW